MVIKDRCRHITLQGECILPSASSKSRFNSMCMKAQGKSWCQDCDSFELPDQDSFQAAIDSVTAKTVHMKIAEKATFNSGLARIPVELSIPETGIKTRLDSINELIKKFPKAEKTLRPLYCSVGAVKEVSFKYDKINYTARTLLNEICTE